MTLSTSTSWQGFIFPEKRFCRKCILCYGFEKNDIFDKHNSWQKTNLIEYALNKKRHNS